MLQRRGIFGKVTFLVYRSGREEMLGISFACQHLIRGSSLTAQFVSAADESLVFILGPEKRRHESVSEFMFTSLCFLFASFGSWVWYKPFLDHISSRIPEHQQQRCYIVCVSSYHSAISMRIAHCVSEPLKYNK